jgi:hypothetical protein
MTGRHLIAEDGFAFKSSEIGGARVLRVINVGGETIQPGQTLTGDQVRSIPRSNRDALIRNRFIAIWPAEPDAKPMRGVELFKVPHGPGKFRVIEGLNLTPDAVPAADANALIAARSARKDN